MKTFRPKQDIGEENLSRTIIRASPKLERIMKRRVPDEKPKICFDPMLNIFYTNFNAEFGKLFYIHKCVNCLLRYSNILE